MKSSMQNISDADLHRFVDGELNEHDARAIADLVAGDEALENKVNEYREINRRLGQIYTGQQPVPARLLMAVSARRGFPFERIAAAFVWLIIGGVIGYLVHGQYGTSEYVRPVAIEAAYAHTVYVPEVRHPVEVNADQQDHLNAWLSKRLNRPIAAPDLRGAGYALIGGRLLPDGHRPAAQFMFENETGSRITLYIRHALNTRETSFRHAENDDLGIVYWVDDGLAFALTASTSKEELIDAAKIVYREANP
ncbi:MAG: anti-sigma factor [Gammaproteobacteria bacterium]|nr:MAG: anti-sigma factor [Gammaproteobacteria bacterium]